MSKKDNQKINIIMGLKRCLSEESFDCVTTRKIAKAADMTLGLLHYYFNSKEDILISYTEYILNEYLSLLEGLIIEDIDSVFDYFKKVMEKTQEDDKVKDLGIALFQIKSFALTNQIIKDKYLDTSTSLQKVIENHLLKFSNDEVYVKKLAILLMTSVDGMNSRKLFHEKNIADYKFFLSLIKNSLL